jgi:NAD(P)-dependent dehydrogenase (short-subunit alcohol dehydrogenase family)
MTLALSLEGQAAFVTGAGGGIGRAIALKLAAAGADVAIFDIDPARAAEAAGQVGALGRRALPIVGDAMSAQALREAVAAADASFGRIDILVNNAGGVSGRPFLSQSEGSWRRHIDLNLVSMLAATHAAAPIMIRERRGGAILNVASIEAERAAPNFAVYAACKAGMVSFTKSMALELSSHAIRVNCIAPDHTVTPGARGNRTGPVDPSLWRTPSPDQADAMARLIPLGREGAPEECGDAAVFLCSPLACYVTGVVLPVDGGTWAAGGWVRGRDGRWTLNEGLAFGG